MQDLNTLAKKCMAELDAINIPYSNNVSFEVNTRAKRWGCCKRQADGIYRIQIAARLLADGITPDGAKNTIIHELLHTCPGGNGHKGNWKRYAQQVNAAYGYDIKRTSTTKEKGITENTDDNAKYVLRCTGCGKTWQYHRLSKAVRNYHACKCNICGRSLELVKGMEPTKAQMTPRYQFVCQDCGAVVRYYRANKFTKNHTAYHCGNCGGKFEQI